MNKDVLVVAAHPDDEVLFCGATIAKHAHQGDRVHILIVAEGLTSRDENVAAEQRAELREASTKAARILGAKSIELGGLPDQMLDTLPFLDLVKLVERHVEKHAPEIIYTHHGGDLNMDHRLLNQAVMTAARPIPGRNFEGIYAGETLSSTEYSAPSVASSFIPSHHVDVAGLVECKIEALKAYEMEMREFPHARSYDAVRALSVLRGAQVGRLAAEAFVTLRTTWG